MDGLDTLQQYIRNCVDISILDIMIEVWSPYQYSRTIQNLLSLVVHRIRDLEEKK